MEQSFTFPDQTVRALENLRKVFGVDSNAKVISRALALAQIIAKQADAENTVFVVGKDEAHPIKLTLNE